MKIAIVGSGIAGLMSAHTLHPFHDITVFEANDYAGGHTNTIAVREGDRSLGVDTGFIVFNPVHYPNFTALLDRLGVPSQPTSMSFSVRCDRTGLEYNGTSLNKLFSQRRNALKPWYWNFLRDILRFNREAPELLEGAPDDRVTVTQYVEQKRLGRAFLDYYLVPLGSSLWSSPSQHFRQFPIRFVVEFLNNHCMLQVEGRTEWRVVQSGSRTYVDAITAPFRDRIRLNSPVRQVCRVNNTVEVTSLHGPEMFDEVVLATHSDQALRLVANPDETEAKILESFPYQSNLAVLHTDSSVLPRRRMAWGSWNYRIPPTDSDRASVTYNMNMLQSLAGESTYCVSLNQDTDLDRSRVIRRIPYEHPLFSRNRHEAQSRHPELIRRNGISYCGAYWGYGFHEDGVNSALRVCQAFERGPGS